MSRPVSRPIAEIAAELLAEVAAGRPVGALAGELAGAVLQAPGVLLAARASTGDLGAALELAGLVLRRRALPVEVAS